MAHRGTKGWVAGSFILIAATVLCGISGCTLSEQPNTAASPEPSHSSVTEHSGVLTDTPRADDYCGLIRELNERADATAELDMNGQISAWGVNLDFLAASMSMLVTHDAERADLWRQAAEAYAATADFYVVSGRQIANDNLLVLLAEAVADSDAAYLATKDRAREECGADVSPLITPER